MYSEYETKEVNQFIVAHTPLVKRVAYRLMTRLPNEVQMDDLLQMGIMIYNPSIASKAENHTLITFVINK